MKKKKSIRHTLALGVALLLILPLISVSLVSGWLTFQVHKHAILVLQAEVLKRVATEIVLTTGQHEALFTFMAASNDLLASDYKGLTRTLSLLHAATTTRYGEVVQEVSVLNRHGDELARVTRGVPATPAELLNRARSEEFLQPTRTTHPYYGPIALNEETRQPCLTLAVPIIEQHSGKTAGVLIGTLRVPWLGAGLPALPAGRDNALYLVDDQGTVVAHSPSGLVQPSLPLLTGEPSGLRTEAADLSVIYSSESFTLGNQQLRLVSETSLAEVLRRARQTIAVALFLGALFLAVAFFVGAAMIRHLVAPLESLTKTATAIREGDVHRRAEEHGSQEMSALSTSFNAMTALLVDRIEQLTTRNEQMQLSRDALGQRVAERTAELEEANEVLQREVATRRQAEEALHRYSRIVNSSSDLMAFVSCDYKFLAINDAYLVAFNKKRDEIIGHGVAEIFGDRAFFELLQKWLNEALNGAEVQHRAWLEVGVAGQRFMELVLSPYWDWDDDRRTTGVVVNGRDVTERVIMENNLRQAEKMQAVGTLAAGIAHDFNNLLHSIFGCARIAQKNVGPDEEAYKWLEKLMQIGQRGADMVKQIKMFGQQAGLSKKDVSLQQVLEEVMRVQTIALSENIRVRTELSGGGQVLADVTQLHQLFTNLLVNAKHAMRDKGGELRVELGEFLVDVEMATRYPILKPGRYGRIVISDTGHGMSPEIQRRIFEPFFTTKSFGKGTGLGLAICHGIVTGLGGVIEVASQPGEGSHFSIYLPLLAASRAPAQTQTPEVVATARPPEKVKSGHILYVDDEESNNEVWGMALRGEGFRVTTATSGREALIHFQEAPHTFDLLITDQKMPGMTGLELTEQLLRIRADLPVILITGVFHEMNGVRDKYPQIKAVVKKPMHMEELIHAIGQAWRNGTDAG